jgi:hypothetical protein
MKNIIILILLLSLFIVFNFISKFGDFKTYDEDLVPPGYAMYSEMLDSETINSIFSTNKFPNLIIEYTTPNNVKESNRYPFISIKNKSGVEIINNSVLLASPQTYFKLISGSGDPTKKGNKIKYFFKGLKEIFNDEMIFNEEYSIGIKLDPNSTYIYKKITFTVQSFIIDEANIETIVFTE